MSPVFSRQDTITLPGTTLATGPQARAAPWTLRMPRGVTGDNLKTQLACDTNHDVMNMLCSRQSEALVEARTVEMPPDSIVGLYPSTQLHRCSAGTQELADSLKWRAIERQTLR